MIPFAGARSAFAFIRIQPVAFPSFWSAELIDAEKTGGAAEKPAIGTSPSGDGVAG